jgi:hypothetical protein
MRARREFIGFLQCAANQVDERNDETADDQRNAPTPGLQILGPHEIRQCIAEYPREHDSNLLAAGLPGHVESLMPRRGDFG